MRAPKLDDPDLPLADLMTHWPQTISVFLQHKMICPGCIISPFHTLADACNEYQLNKDVLISELMEAIGIA